MLQVSVAMSPGHSGPGSVRRPLMEGSKETRASKIIIDLLHSSEVMSFPVSLVIANYGMYGWSQ